MGTQKAIFLDLFGTLIHDHGAMDKISDIQFKNKSLEALRELLDKDYIIFLSVCKIGMPIPGRSYLEKVQSYVLEKLLSNGFINDSIHFISRVEPQRVDLHPITFGVINSLKDEYDLKLSACVMVGDLMKDISVGKRAGVKTALLSSPDDSPIEVDDDWKEPDIIGENLLEITNQLFHC